MWKNIASNLSSSEIQRYIYYYTAYGKQQTESNAKQFTYNAHWLQHVVNNTVATYVPAMQQHIYTYTSGGLETLAINLGIDTDFILPSYNICGHKNLVMF